jgi:hypothetical protein
MQNKEEIKNEENIIEEKPKKKFIFKDYYNSHPEFKETHKQKMKEKALCPGCGNLVNKYAMSRHLKTSVHKTKMEFLQNNQ